MDAFPTAYLTYSFLRHVPHVGPQSFPFQSILDSLPLASPRLVHSPSSNPCSSTIMLCCVRLPSPSPYPSCWPPSSQASKCSRLGLRIFSVIRARQRRGNKLSNPQIIHPPAPQLPWCSPSEYASLHLAAIHCSPRCQMRSSVQATGERDEVRNGR